VEAGGARLGFSSDTAFDPDLIAFLSAADLIVHETNYGPAHTPYASLRDTCDAPRSAAGDSELSTKLSNALDRPNVSFVG
jgi:hypothetical protein